MEAESGAIRASRPEDAVRLVEIERLVASAPWNLSQFISACRSDSSHVRVSPGSGAELSGFAIYTRVLDEASLLNIAVHPAYQGQGHGRALLQSVLAELRHKSAARLMLEVRASNEPAISLYRSTGFLDDGRRKNYYPASHGREDALLMSFDLATDV